MKKSYKTAEIDCLGLGIVPLDYLVTIKKYLPPGGKADATGLTIQGGGPVPNALTGLTRLGLKTALISAVGNDIIGQLVKKELHQEGINISCIVTKNKSQSASAYGFVEEKSGRRSIVLHRQIQVRPDDIKLSNLPIPRVVHLDGRDLDACLKLARWGRRVGAIITFDIGSIRNDVSPIFPLVDHLIVSDDYALGFTRVRNVRQAIQKLGNYCPGAIVVTEGTRGVVAHEDNHWYTQKAYRVKNVDTTGAGDAFHAGYLYQLLQGADMPTRLQFGAVVAAIKCTQAGARAGLPTMHEISRFMKKLPKYYA